MGTGAEVMDNKSKGSAAATVVAAVAGSVVVVVEDDGEGDTLPLSEIMEEALSLLSIIIPPGGTAKLGGPPLLSVSSIKSPETEPVSPLSSSIIMVVGNNVVDYLFDRDSHCLSIIMTVLATVVVQISFLVAAL